MPTHKEQWQRFRAEVIELDGSVCGQCGRGSKDGVVLQVHHKEYISGRNPWDYPYNLCETLCQGCHAAEHGIIPPKIGWDYLGEDDLGDLSGSCEYCGNSIRYVFYIHHPKWEPLGVGTICCDNLTGTEFASNHMESLRRFVSRQTRFVESSRWKEKSGNYFIAQKKINILIHSTSSGFQIQMNGCEGRKKFSSLKDAKEAVFEVIENGKAEKYLQKRLASC